MEPITSALVAALAELGSDVIKDSYEGIKSLIVRKFGRHHPVADALEQLEHQPTSPGRQATLNEEVVSAKLAEDPEIISHVSALLEKIGKLPGGQHVQQDVRGDHSIVVGIGSVAVTKT